MVLDETLLKDARSAAERLAALESETAAATQRYHHSIRRLHVAGSSMREIADALELSHQRVHQIIEDGGGLRRRWKLRKPSGKLACSFCEKSSTEVTKLIAGAQAYICGDCIEDARSSKFDRVHAASTLPCSFCLKPRKKLGRMSAGAHAQICEECLRLCKEIAGSA